MRENIPTLTSKKYSYKALIKDVLVAALMALAISIFIRPVIVSGPSMEPTFHNGNFLIVWKMGEIERGDVVVFWEDDAYLIKRVVGVDGDHISSENGRVFCNGEDMGEGVCESQTVNGYFVMGDNRNNSMDSRDFGSIDKVMGKVVLRLFPCPETIKQIDERKV